MKVIGVELVLVAVFFSTGSLLNAQESEDMKPLRTIDGRTNPASLSLGFRLEYVLNGYQHVLKEKMTAADFSVVSAATEKARAAKQARKKKEHEEFDFLCRNYKHLDNDSIVQMLDDSRMRQIDVSATAINNDLSGLSPSGRAIWQEIADNAEFQITIVHPDIGAFAQKYPAQFRARLEENCLSYLQTAE